MKSFPWDVLVLAVVLAVNRLATPRTYFHPTAFWAIQAVNAVLALAVGIWGLPGLGAFPSVGWLIGGVLAFHGLQNVALRTQAVDQRARAAAERERMRKLRALEALPESSEAPPPEG